MSETPRSSAMLLRDMLNSCCFLMEQTKGVTRQHYCADRWFRRAVERELMIIGEALFQLSRRYEEIARRVPDYERIIGFRHVLVHAYATLDDDKVWDVVELKLEPLRLELEKLVSEIKP